MTPPPSASPSTPEERPLVDVLRGVLRDLWRYKLIIPAMTVLVAGIVAFHTTREPRIYEAAATIEYDPNPSRPLGKAVEDTASSTSYWGTQEFYETQNYILKSRGIAERVVRKLGLHQDPEFLGMPKGFDASGFEGVPVEKAAEQLMGMIKVGQLPDTRIVRIAVESRSPDQAQLIANAIADTYIEKSLEDRMGTSARALEWLGGQMDHLKQELESAELALYRYREENQALSASLAERQKIIAAQLQHYSQQLTEIRTKRIQVEARLSVLQELMASTENPLTIQAGPIAGDSAVHTLRDQYRAAHAALEKLAVTYGPAHPQVQTARAERDTLHRQLKEHIEAIVAGINADLLELSRAERGIQQALAEVNRQGLQLSIQETEYLRLDRERQSKADLYALVMERAAQTDLTRALRVANARIVDRALRPSFSIRPKIRVAVTLGAILGLMLGIALALGIAQLDNKVRGVADLEAKGLTVLGVVPAVAANASQAAKRRARRRKSDRVESPERDLIVHREPRSTIAECCRTIRTNLTFQSADNPLRTLAVTSAMPRDGKTTISISLAITIAQSGRRVLLVDTDLRKPRLHRAFGLPTGAGITSVLAGESALSEAAQATDVPGLTLLQCGPIPPNPSELLHTRRFAELVEDAKGAYDFVIFDSPPLGAVTDPAIISTYVDGMVVVIRARSTTRAGVDLALRQLKGVSARIVGAVLNDVDLTEGAYSNYYAYYRGYYAEDEPRDSGTGTRAARTSS